MTMTQAIAAMKAKTTVQVPHLGLTAEVRDIRTTLARERVAMVWGSDGHLYYFDFSELSA